jgi:hypothetical protein
LSCEKANVAINFLQLTVSIINLILPLVTLGVFVGGYSTHVPLVVVFAVVIGLCFGAGISFSIDYWFASGDLYWRRKIAEVAENRLEYLIARNYKGIDARHGSRAMYYRNHLLEVLYGQAKACGQLGAASYIKECIDEFDKLEPRYKDSSWKSP